MGDLAAGGVAVDEDFLGIEAEVVAIFGEVAEGVLAVGDAVADGDGAAFIAEAVVDRGDGEAFIEEGEVESLEGGGGDAVLAAGGPATAVCVDDEGEFGVSFFPGIIEVEVELFFADGFVNEVELLFAFGGEAGLFDFGEFVEGEGLVFVEVEAGEAAPLFSEFGFFEEAVFVGIASGEEVFGAGGSVVIRLLPGEGGESEEGEEGEEDGRKFHGRVGEDSADFSKGSHS